MTSIPSFRNRRKHTLQIIWISKARVGTAFGNDVVVKTWHWKLCISSANQPRMSMKKEMISKARVSTDIRAQKNQPQDILSLTKWWNQPSRASRLIVKTFIPWAGCSSMQCRRPSRWCRTPAMLLRYVLAIESFHDRSSTVVVQRRAGSHVLCFCSLVLSRWSWRVHPSVLFEVSSCSPQTSTDGISPLRYLSWLAGMSSNPRYFAYAEITINPTWSFSS